MSADRAIVIFRSALLSASETFIRNHGTTLTRWRPTFVGATAVESALAAPTDVIAFPHHPGAFLRLRLTGRSARLEDLLNGLRPALVHAHFGGDGWLVSRTAERIGVPLVITVHGHDVTRQPGTPGLRGLRYRRNLRTAFDRAAVILAVSQAIRAKAIALGADPAKVRLHYTGVPVPATAPTAPKVWDVIFVGRFVEKKGVDDLIEALGTIRDPRPRALFIGAGPSAAAIRQRAAALDVDATFLGVQGPDVVSRCLAESKILVAPSRTASDGDTEGLPTTILEAAALGLPTVSTRHSGIPEAVVHGETGLLGPEGDRSSLAGNIRRLLADDALRARLGGQGRRHVQARFDLSRQTELLEELYDEVVARSSTTRSPSRMRGVS